MSAHDDQIQSILDANGLDAQHLSDEGFTYVVDVATHGFGILREDAEASLRRLQARLGVAA